MSTYSFLDVQASIDGPGGNFPLAGDAAGIAEEGITIEPTGDKNGMTPGADGSWMHSLYGDKTGTVTVRLLKTSTVNAQLQNMYNFQTASSANHGKNVITVRDVARGDTVTCSGVAFAKQPTAAYAKDGGVMEWTFHAGSIEKQLGTGSPEKGA
jgi:hypothetical protein